MATSEGYPSRPQLKTTSQKELIGIDDLEPVNPNTLD